MSDRQTASPRGHPPEPYPPSPLGKDPFSGQEPMIHGLPESMAPALAGHETTTPHLYRHPSNHKPLASHPKKRPINDSSPPQRPYLTKSPRRSTNSPRLSPDTQPQSIRTTAAQRTRSPVPYAKNAVWQRSQTRLSAVAQPSLPPAGPDALLSTRDRRSLLPHEAAVPSPGRPSHSLGPNRTAQDVIESNHDKLFSRASRDEVASEDEYDDDVPDPDSTDMIRQPESRPISHEQLAAEVKGIYSGLVLVENKCITIINQHAATNLSHIQPGAGHSTSEHPRQMDHFQTLIALHRTLLHEHHDFLLASQHPSASRNIRDLAAKYSMPARMWKHGIHNFLELLRERLPESLDYMLAFIYLAYQMMALLYDTVPAFRETWIECLGDLARYRMAIEDDDLRDREIWTNVARMWYLRAVDGDPSVGRLYHHLAILARNDPVQQLSSYCRALTANQPFLGARDSILTLFEPVLIRWRDPHARSISAETWFVVCHALMFQREPYEQLDTARMRFLGQLNDQIGRVTTRWRDTGAYLAVANIGSILKYGCADSKIHKFLAPQKAVQPSLEIMEPKRDAESPDPDDLPAEGGSIPNEWNLATETLSICLRRSADSNVLPHVHVMIVFLWRLASTPQGAVFTAYYTPWMLLSTFLNAMISSLHISTVHETKSFPAPAKSVDCTPLAEDFAMNGQVWCNDYFPQGWFETASADLDERFMEKAATLNQRAHRILWLARRLAECLPAPDILGDQAQWLAFDALKMRFAYVAPYSRSLPERVERDEMCFAGSAPFSDSRHARVKPGNYHPTRIAEADHGFDGVHVAGFGPG